MLTHSRYLFGGWTPNLPIDEPNGSIFFTKIGLFLLEMHLPTIDFQGTC